jgi:hypothetical protein
VLTLTQEVTTISARAGSLSLTHTHTHRCMATLICVARTHNLTRTPTFQPLQPLRGGKTLTLQQVGVGGERDEARESISAPNATQAAYTDQMYETIQV